MVGAGFDLGGLGDCVFLVGMRIRAVLLLGEVLNELGRGPGDDGNDEHGGGRVWCFLICGMSFFFIEIIRDYLFQNAFFGLVLQTVCMQRCGICSGVRNDTFI